MERQLRPGESKDLLSFCQLVANLYPQHFSIGEYEHPILGTRKTLVIRQWEGKEVDIQNITKFEFDFDSKELFIHTVSPTTIYAIKDFVKTDGVM